MSGSMTRRRFVELMGTAASLAAAPRGLARAGQPAGKAAKIKPIRGSWISILWPDRRHYYWNDTCAKFSAEQWEYAVKEMADIGMEYLVLLAACVNGRSLYDSSIVSRAKELACTDPLEAILTAADKFGVKFFVENGGFIGWSGVVGRPADIQYLRKGASVWDEIAAKYGHHKSFYGWYCPSEPPFPYSDRDIASVNAFCRQARKLMPRAKTLIAPGGTLHHGNLDVDKYVRQLEQLDVDVIAYQDKIGCHHIEPVEKALDASDRAFAKLRKAHDKVPQRALWADVETFDWEGPPNAQTSPLIPTTFTRLKKQLEAVSPYVDVITVYQYQGIMNQPGSKAPAGHPDAKKLYTEYVNWLKAEYPELVK